MILMLSRGFSNDHKTCSPNTHTDSKDTVAGIRRLFVHPLTAVLPKEFNDFKAKDKSINHPVSINEYRLNKRKIFSIIIFGESCLFSIFATWLAVK